MDGSLRGTRPPADRGTRPPADRGTRPPAGRGTRPPAGRGTRPPAGRIAPPEAAGGLSDSQKRILKFIRDSIEQTGRPPSIREIGQATGMSSPASVYDQLEKLERTGHITRERGKTRAIKLTEAEELASRAKFIPVVGQIAAGTPTLAQENIEEYLPVPVEFSEAAFALKVKGDSMTGAGILDGDCVIVREQDYAENNDIVVALIENEATVKRLRKENGAVCLMPENPAYKPIITHDVKILGKVVGLIRKL